MRRLEEAPGPDGLPAEHPKAGGEAVTIWHSQCCRAVRGDP